MNSSTESLYHTHKNLPTGRRALEEEAAPVVLPEHLIPTWEFLRRHTIAYAYCRALNSFHGVSSPENAALDFLATRNPHRVQGIALIPSLLEQPSMMQFYMNHIQSKAMPSDKQLLYLFDLHKELPLREKLNGILLTKEQASQHIAQLTQDTQRQEQEAKKQIDSILRRIASHIAHHTKGEKA